MHKWYCSVFDCAVRGPALPCPQQKCNSWARCRWLCLCFSGTYRLRFSKKATNKGPLVLVWMMATLEPVPVTYGHGAWLRAHKCDSLCMLCQPMAHGMDGQFRTGGQAYPQHYMSWANRAQTLRSTPLTQGLSQPWASLCGGNTHFEQRGIFYISCYTFFSWEFQVVSRDICEADGQSCPQHLCGEKQLWGGGQNFPFLHLAV